MVNRFLFYIPFMFGVIYSASAVLNTHHFDSCDITPPTTLVLMIE